jgi:sialic acid synthase SpsE
MKIFIIAEAGKNFIYKDPITIREALERAKALALRAKECGASAVKYQTHVFLDEQNKRSSKRNAWIIKNETLTPLDLFWIPLKEYCDEIGIEFMTTPMSMMAAVKINSLVKRWKIGSADITDFELLSYLVSTKKPIIMSTGMSTLDQIDEAVKYLQKNKADFSLLHCVSIYPCPPESVNLLTIPFLATRYGVPVGFSDHSLSLSIPVQAVKLGARVIEKHFTLDRDCPVGPDHKASLEPSEFAPMVLAINNTDTRIFGEVGKFLLPEEKTYWDNFRTNHD